MKEDNRKKDNFVDDGRTIANMDFDTISNYRKDKDRVDYGKRRQEISELNLTAKEKWAIVKALYAKLIPFVVLMFVGFIVVFFIISLIWKIL